MKMYFEDECFKWVDIEITNNCNFDCWFCPRGVMTRDKGLMDFGDFKEMALNLYLANFLSEILIGGIGEPTLHPDLTKMLAFIKKETDLKAVLITNGSRFNDQSFVDKLFESNLDKIIVSFRITDPHKNKSSLPPNFDYEGYFNSLLDLVESKYRQHYKTNIEFAFLKETYFSKFILNLKAENFINETTLNKFLTRLSEIMGVSLPSYNDYTRNISSRLSNVDNISITSDIGLRFDGPSCWTTAVEKYKDTKKSYPAKYGSCFGLSEHFAIYWNGDVSTCCADFNVKNCLGNIFKEKDIIKILSNKKSMFYADSLSRKRMPTITCQICRGGKTRKEKWASMLGTLAFAKSSAS